MAPPSHRALLRGIATLALAALLALSAASIATARSDRTAAALATEHYYASFGNPVAQHAGERAALAAERYYTTFAEHAPLRAATAAPVPDAGDGGGPSWTAAILAGALIALAAAGAGAMAGLSTGRRARA